MAGEEQPDTIREFRRKNYLFVKGTTRIHEIILEVQLIHTRCTKIRPRCIYSQLQRWVLQVIRHGFQGPISLTHVVGRTRIDRLHLIGTSSSVLYAEALKAALAEAKKGKDVTLYEKIVDALHDLIPNDPDSIPDVAWMDRMNKQIKAETTRLEQELKGYKNNLIKESIRVCQISKKTASRNGHG